MARLPFIDWVRGFAVVSMVLWHTGDGFLLPGVRDGQGWLFLRFVGGLAAPSFLFLAGVGAALAVRQQPDPLRRARAFRASLARGLEILIIGYLLRFQTWMIDAAAIRQLGTARAYLPLGLGYALLYFSVKKLDDHPKIAVRNGAIALVLVAVGLVQVESVAEGRLLRLLQVDVLQAIGTSLILLTLLERSVALLSRPRLALGLGVFIGGATHLVWTHLPGPLPHGLAGFLGKYAPPTGAPPSSLFPLFPWFAYACLGAAVGSVLREARANPENRLVQLALFGACLALLTSEAHPYLHNLFALEPWTVHPVRVAFRVGIVLTLFLVGWVWADGGRGGVLLDYGRTSLRIYWAHMLVAYGVLGQTLQKRSGYLQWMGYVLLILIAMWFLSRIGADKPTRKPAAT